MPDGVLGELRARCLADGLAGAGALDGALGHSGAGCGLRDGQLAKHADGELPERGAAGLAVFGVGRVGVGPRRAMGRLVGIGWSRAPRQVANTIRAARRPGEKGRSCGGGSRTTRLGERVGLGGFLLRRVMCASCAGVSRNLAGRGRMVVIGSVWVGGHALRLSCLLPAVRIPPGPGCWDRDQTRGRWWAAATGRRPSQTPRPGWLYPDSPGIGQRGSSIHAQILDPRAGAARPSSCAEMVGLGLGGRWAGRVGSDGRGGVMSRFGWVGVRGRGGLSVGVVVGVLGCWAAGARAHRRRGRWWWCRA